MSCASDFAQPAYENGSVPASQLESVGNNQRLHHNAANAWFDEVDAAAAQGVTLTVTNPWGGYRNSADQLALAAENPIASPTCSTHGWGTCVDLFDNYDWAVDNFNRDLWSHSRWNGAGHSADDEYNHWQYIGPITNNSSGTPSQPQIEDEDMRLFKVVNAANTTYYFIVGNQRWQSITGTYMSTLRNAGFPEGDELTSTQWARVRNSLTSLGYSESEYPSPV